MAIQPKNPLATQEEVENLVAFRDDLRPPKVVFGRCAITGEWSGKCATIDLGDICFQEPDTERGVSYDPETGKVDFSVWKPVVFNNQLIVSEMGLKRLLEFVESQENAIPGVTPELVYKWQVSYKNGSALSQFRATESGEEEEVNSAEIDFPEIAQISIVPRIPNSELPTITFVRETGKFYSSGNEIDTMYDGSYVDGAEIVYCRRVAHTWGSVVGPNGLDRQIANMHTTVLQIIGWRVGGLNAVVDKLDTPGCLIAVDERGHWRPFDYTYEHR